MGFTEIVAAWKDYGIFEFYLPFVLMFAIFYGLLRRSKIFGDHTADKRVNSLNVVISIVAALFVMVYTPAGVTLTAFFGTFFTQTMVVLTTILCFALILHMLLPPGAAENLFKDPAKYAKFLVPFAMIIVLIIFFSAGGLEIFGIKLGSPGRPTIIFPGLELSSEDVVVIFMVLVFILVLWLLTRDEGTGKGKKVIGYRPTPIYEGEKLS